MIGTGSLDIIEKSVGGAGVKRAFALVDRVGKRADDKLASVGDAGLGRELFRDLDHRLGKIDADHFFGTVLCKRDAKSARAAADIEYLFTGKRLEFFNVDLKTFLHDAAPIIVDKSRESALFLVVDRVESLRVVVKMVANLFFDTLFDKYLLA